MSLVVEELDLFELCDIVRLKLTVYHDYPINAHVMKDGSGNFFGCIGKQPTIIASYFYIVAME